ncbi:MAG: hypothetical protein OXC62_15650 [Aestuariivita sp.]|nr:hypothetical protein [Aestuariivita sp.]
MNTDRTVLTNEMWERIRLLLSGKVMGFRRTADNRPFLGSVDIYRAAMIPAIR